MCPEMSDVYTADGVTYTKSAVYADNLVALAGEPLPRSNGRLRRIAATTVNGTTTEHIFDFDALGRPRRSYGVAFQSGDLYAGQIDYDSHGFVSHVYQAPSSNITVRRDAAGHPLTISEAAGREADFTWRSDGQPQTSIIHGVTYTYSYDDAAGGTKNPTGIVDSRGRTDRVRL